MSSEEDQSDSNNEEDLSDAEESEDEVSLGDDQHSLTSDMDQNSICSEQFSICSGGVFSDIASVMSVASENLDPNSNEVAPPKRNISEIRNRQRRTEAYIKQRREQRKEKMKLRKQRQQLREQLGEDAPPVQPQKTLDNMREKEDTMVFPDDKEVLLDEDTDEMQDYFKRKTMPKILLTTSDRPRSRTTRFLKELSESLPNSHVYYRRALDLKKIIPQCIGKGFTDLMVINEDRKTPNSILLCHLPNGPTAHFKLSNVKVRKEIRNSTTPSEHQPEVILNNFSTRLGHTVGRMLAALYPHDPQFKGRQVATFHNQRDFIFFRHHRYIFRNEKRVGLQEIGPRFTLKLRSLQKGVFDSKFGEFEWIHKRHEMDTSRKKFHL